MDKKTPNFVLSWPSVSVGLGSTIIAKHQNISWQNSLLLGAAAFVLTQGISTYKDKRNSDEEGKFRLQEADSWVSRLNSPIEKKLPISAITP